ncbi:NEL-type E3 ubiquitin ligase domain-containing protein [Pseudomonas juntendi]|uniref:NEL-type E3 ubiquitin ligase domain-containing protein n=1 Tax=Pseudomonas juntendi TaxID=2666183 RepID=UPI001F1941A9|nr:NEL-type E3 ubiquitin ligase domain-containing protein [Pseudomonas juntendi]
MPSQPVKPWLQHPVERFIANRLPDWLSKASPVGLAALQSALDAHLASQRTLSSATEHLQPLMAFAEARLNGALGLGVPLDRLTWREERRRLRVDLGGIRQFESYFVRVPALEKLLQNFKPRESFFEQTALVRPPIAPEREEQALPATIDAVVAACREADIGKAYQGHLAAIMNAAFERDLALDKRLELALATEIATLKGQLKINEVRMLRQLGRGDTPTHPGSHYVRVGGLQVLGCRVDGALVIELLDSWSIAVSGAGRLLMLKGVLLYLPDDQARPLQYYPDWPTANRALVAAMAAPQYRSAFARRIALSERAGYQALLATRLLDDEPDLQPRRLSTSTPIFEQMAAWHIQRIKADAQYLAVPTEQADSEAAAERLRALEGVGEVLLNLAGLFVPVVGTLLMADMARQLLGQVFEGFSDWSQGHQHEALQHMMQVATSLAVNGAVLGGAYALHSAFVGQLHPVTNEAGQARLWHDDLAPYRQALPAAPLTTLENGLLTDGSGHWWRCDEALYSVREDRNGTWRLLHREGPDVYGPALQTNGERAWRLVTERPLEWQGTARLLARLWPAAQSLAPERLTQILKVADVDEAFLRGLLVEERPLPVQLRDTLERFAVDARIVTFFQQLDTTVNDTKLLQWCVHELDIDADTLPAQLAQIALHAQSLREGMFEYFSCCHLGADTLQSLLARDYPGLPHAYTLDVLSHASDAMRAQMESTGRVPLGLAQQARASLQLARLTRAREAFYLRCSYHPDAVALAFALLRRQGSAQSMLNLELRDRSVFGPLQERLLPQAGSQQTLVMVWRDGAFTLYDEQGLPAEREVAEPAGLFEVLAACLPSASRQRLGTTGGAAADSLRLALQGAIPERSSDLLKLLGWREARALGTSMRRLPDGRLGYLLGGGASRLPSASSIEQILRNRLRGLYPSFSDDDVDRYLGIMAEIDGSPFDSLLLQEQEFRRLNEELQRWMFRVMGPARHARRRLASALLRAWRLEGERVFDAQNNPVGLRLHVADMAVGELPTLPQGSSFGHVAELTLAGLHVPALPPGFLGCFRHLRTLDLSDNALRELPEGLEEMPELTQLILRNNNIRPSAGQVAALLRCVNLRRLDLNDNPLGALQLDVSGLHRLQRLRLRRTGLTSMPSGLQWCARLEYADLRDNQIAELPQALLDAPAAVRQVVDVEGNALPTALREQLYAPEIVPVPLMLGEGAEAQAMHAWLGTRAEADQAVGREQWQALRSEPGSDAFFELLVGMTQSAEFRLAPEQLGARVWTLVEALSVDRDLREALFALADEPRACADNLANCFSNLEVRYQVLHATQGGEPVATRDARLLLARRLYRLDTVLALARADINSRYADGRWQRGDHAEEEVEVSLAYRTGLAERLNLIGQPRYMLFGALAVVSEADLERACNAVLAGEASEDITRYISQRDFWIEVLRAEHPQDFALIQQQFEQAMEALEERMQQLGSGAYDAQARTLMRDRQEALEALALRLTRERLNRA